MKRKILSVLFALLLVATFPAVAEGELSVSYPLNGAVLSPTDTSVSVDDTVGCDYIVLYLDGEEIAKLENGNNAFETESEYSLGTHTVKAVGVKGSDVFEAENTFSVALSEESIIATDDMAGAPKMNYLSPVMATNSKADSVTGRGGEGDNAFAFMITSSSSSSISPYIWKNGINWTNLMTIEMDLYLTSSASITFETKSSKGFGFLFGDKVFGNSIKSGSEFFPLKEWFRVKMVVDFTGLSSDMWIGKYDAEGNVTYKKAIENYTQSANIKGSTQIKFQPAFPWNTEAGEYLAVDNLLITETKFTRGFSSLSYEDGEEFKEAEVGIVPKGTKKIKLSSPGYFEEDVTEKISATADGAKINIEKANISGGNLTVEFKSPLISDADVTVFASEEMLLSNKQPTQFKTEYSFKTTPEYIKIDKVDILSGSEKVLTHYQLSGKQSLDAEVYLSSSLEDDKSILLILSAFEDGKCSSLTCINETIKAGALSQKVTIPVSQNFSENTEIEIYAAESFLNSVPLTNIWSLK